MTEVILVGCKTFTRAGKQYESETVYTVDSDTAEALLTKENDYGMKYFQEHGVQETQKLSPKSKKVTAPARKNEPASVKVSISSGTEEAVSL
jgi:hypothetical protein